MTMLVYANLLVLPGPLPTLTYWTLTLVPLDVNDNIACLCGKIVQENKTRQTRGNTSGGLDTNQ